MNNYNDEGRTGYTRWSEDKTSRSGLVGMACDEFERVLQFEETAYRRGELDGIAAAVDESSKSTYFGFERYVP